jgi:hypothetical protein
MLDTPLEVEDRRGPGSVTIVIVAVSLAIVLLLAWISYQRAHSPINPLQTGTEVSKPAKHK